MHKGFFVGWACLFSLFLFVTKGYSQAPCADPVMIAEDGSYFDTIMEAYDYASIDLGLNDFTLMLTETLAEEDLSFDQDVLVVLDGGFDCSFLARDRSTNVPGSLTIYAGRVTPSNIVFSIAPCDGSDVTLCTNSGDCTAAGGYWSIDTCIGVVVSADGRVWMDRDLDASQVASSYGDPAAYDDPAAYGGLYQWGREADGHQLGGAPTLTPSFSDSPGHGDFILAEYSPFDWRVPQNDNLWQGVSGTNNPCPVGFRIPTEAEWQTEMASWDSMDAKGAFDSPLKLVLGGYHCHYCGNYFDDGALGYYWSSTVNGDDAHYLRFGPIEDSAITGSEHRAYGYSVRCIQD